MTVKRAVASAIAGTVLAVLVLAALVGGGDDADEPTSGPRVAEGGPSQNIAAPTERGHPGARRAATSGQAGETAAREARTTTEALEEPGWNVYLLRARGGALRRLTDTESEVPENPDWSRAGSRIVFAGMDCEDCDAGLRIVNADGSRSQRVRSPVGNVADPSWSPSGRRVAVTRVGGVIYSLDSATGVARRLTGHRKASEGPAWSPDAHKIAYARQVSAANWDIFLMNTDGRGKRPITRGPRQELAPAWSRDGRKIAFQRLERSGVWAIYTANADGSSPRKITRGGTSSEQPAWSPDGRKIAFVRVTVAGSRIVVVQLRGRRHQQAFVTPPSMQAAYPDWSPDGARIAFTAKHLHHD